MTTQMLQTADKLLFVKHLYDYSSRVTNNKVRKSYSVELGVSERSFQDKIITQRQFKGEELDTVERLYKSELGDETFDKQFIVFLDNMSNGDLRTLKGDAAFQNLDDAAQTEIDQLKEEMENGQVLITKQVS